MKRMLLLAVACAAVAAVLASSAGATYGPTAEFQVTISENCNNSSFCGPDLGGFWGWAVFNNDGSADAELTGCGHVQGGPGGGGGGAQHMSSDAEWTVLDDGDFGLTSETVTYTGHGTPVTLFDPNPPYPSDTGIPAAPGHYNTSFFLGFTPPPGVHFTINVTEIPNR